MAHIECNFYSPALMRNTNLVVFLPSIGPDDYIFHTDKSFLAPEKKYQVLYLLHGSYDDCFCWSRNSCIERYAQEKCLAVVMPSVENSAYMNMAYGEQYETYITEELSEFLATIFPISRKREDTFIAGLSMGGGGAFRYALKFPDKYGAAASLSGGLDSKMLESSAHLQGLPKNYMRAITEDGKTENVLDLIDTVNPKELPPLYMVCGTEDFIFPCNESFYSKAADAGIKIKYEKYPGIHSWEFWDDHIQDVLEWLPLSKEMV